MIVLPSAGRARQCFEVNLMLPVADGKTNADQSRVSKGFNPDERATGNGTGKANHRQR
jgi:hypothetical protein